MENANSNIQGKLYGSYFCIHCILLCKFHTKNHNWTCEKKTYLQKKNDNVLLETAIKKIWCF